MTWRDRIAAAIMIHPLMTPSDQAYADFRRSPNVEDRRQEGLMPDEDYNAIAAEQSDPRSNALNYLRAMMPQNPTPMGIELGTSDLDRENALNFLRRR